MMKALIPEPALLANAQNLMMPERRTAQHTQIACHILLHQLARGGNRIGVLTQIVHRRGAERLRLRPLHGHTIPLAKRHIQRIRFLHAEHDRL